MSDPNPVVKDVENFDKQALKRTTTAEKNFIPTQQDIDQEKAEQQKQKQGCK